MTTKKTRREIEREVDKFDWSKVDALTDEQIIAAAKADPDALLPTEEELANFDLVIPAKSRRKPPQAAE